MKQDTQICQHCKRPMNVYTFRLTRSLANCLIKIAENVPPQAPFNAKALFDVGVISSSDYTNVSHLKYLGLIKRSDHEARTWTLTEAAVRLIAGGSIAAWVKVYDNKVTEVSTDQITLKETRGYYNPPVAWSKESQRLTAKTEIQEDLFIEKEYDPDDPDHERDQEEVTA
jgi:hypothetical protein